MADFSDAISGIESGGNYGLLGPITKSGDRAYGKYQVMGQNVGPWSKEILGVGLTPQQFLADPKAQDAVFQGKFDQYVKQYGPEGAARAWFAGPGGMNNPNRKDQLGTSVANYGRRFMLGLGQEPTSQQPSTPIQSPQGSPPQQVASPNPPRLQSTPNSPAMIGGSPNMALTNGGGYPMGGLPTQSPFPTYNFNQMSMAQPVAGPANPQFRMQQHQQNLQNFRQLLSRLGGYSFSG